MRQHIVTPTVHAPCNASVATRINSRYAVRPSDLDSLGHVNNAAVLEYLEYGRWEWLMRFGMRLADGVVPVVARVEVDYRCEIFMGEIAIMTDLASESFYKVLFNQSIDIGAGSKRKTAAAATVHIAFIDSSSRRPRRVREVLTQSFGSPRVSARLQVLEHGRETLPPAPIAAEVAHSIAGVAVRRVRRRSMFG